MDKTRVCPRVLLSQLLWLFVVALTPSMALTSVDSLVGVLTQTAMASQEWLVDIRRQLHRIPELGSTEFKTSAFIKAKLGELDVSYSEGWFGTGLVATIDSGNTDGPVVALRADMDALPVQEPEGLSFASIHPGKMHACGHDGHTSMLLGAAKVLATHKHQLPPGQVRLVFQPNEEFGAGGQHLVDEGALDGVSSVFGMHVAPWIASGKLGLNPHTLMAGALSFHITITGRGGHAAMPHLNADPVVAVATLVTSLQTLISRETSPLGSAVLSVTLLTTGQGQAYNVIPDKAEFGGTIRGLSHELLVRLQRRVENMSQAVASAFSCNASVDWRLNEQPYYVPLVNDPETVHFARQVAERVLGAGNVLQAEPIMAGEDFAFMCRKAPCSFGFLGILNETLGNTYALHNSKFMLDEEVLHKGAALHASWAAVYLLQAQENRNVGQYTSESKRDEL